MFIEQKGNVDILKFLQTAINEVYGDCEATYSIFHERHEPFDSCEEQM